jgi:hypothetical protein
LDGEREVLSHLEAPKDAPHFLADLSLIKRGAGAPGDLAGNADEFILGGGRYFSGPICLACYATRQCT